MPRILITSPQNERIKTAGKLRDRKGRERQQRFLIDGELEIDRALAGNVPIETIYVVAQHEAEFKPKWNQWETFGPEVVAITANVMEKLAYGERRETAVAVAKPFDVSLSSLDVRCPLLKSNTNPLILVLEGVEKPGNIGAVLRTADAAGVSAVFVADGGTDLFNPNVVRASRGTLFSVPVAVGSSGEILAWLRQRQIRIFTARADAKQDYAAVSWREPAAIAFGSEALGLTATWAGADVTAVRLPMCGVIDSLNVSITAAVVSYEVLRQRTTGDNLVSLAREALAEPRAGLTEN